MRSTATLRHHLANLERKGIVKPRAYNKRRQIALIQPLAA